MFLINPIEYFSALTLNIKKYLYKEIKTNMQYLDRKKLSDYLHDAPYSTEVLELYKSRTDWFTERRLRRLVFHTSEKNDHLTLPCKELCFYASRLISMEEAFLIWFKDLPESYRNLIKFLVEKPVLSEDFAYRTSGIMPDAKNNKDYAEHIKKEILCDIDHKEKYILENIAVYKNGFIFSPAVIRRYMAFHLSSLNENKKNTAPKQNTEAKFFSSIPKENVPVLEKADLGIAEKLLSAKTIHEAVDIAAHAPNSFDAAVLVPHLNLNARYWNSPKTTQEKIRQIDSVCDFLQGKLFENWIDFSEIENSFCSDVIDSIPSFYIPELGKGYFIQVAADSPKTRQSGSAGRIPAVNSSCFGKRIEISDSDFFYSFVSVPAFHNLLLILCRLGFFECTLEKDITDSSCNALLYTHGKIHSLRKH